MVENGGETGMQIWTRRAAIGFCACVMGLAAAAAVAAEGRGPEVGDVAPAFELQGSDGKTYRLEEFSGRQAVVIAWFPKAFTSGCTIECKSLAENGHLIREYDVTYFMASVDSVEDNAGFAAEQNADFPLLSDPTKAVARAYGVLGDAGLARRHTYYIGADGRILAIDRNVRPATSAEDMAATLGEIGVARR
jgi:thioredoxin-dependent peroxiredoxin